MTKVLVEDSGLFAIANTLRKYLGETKNILVPTELPKAKISKTPNAISSTEQSGGYGNNTELWDTVTIEGASKIKIKMSFQTEGTNYDWVQVMSGSTTVASGAKFGGKTLDTVEFEFSGDTVTFYFKSDSSTHMYLGYYAEIRGLDAEGNYINNGVEGTELVPLPTPTPNLFKVADMDTAIDNIGNQLSMIAMNTITSIIIPDDVTYIGADAFYGQTELIRVVLPEGLTSLKNGCFEGCTKLREINLPSSLTSIEANSFNNCKNLAISEVPTGVTTISTHTFAHNSTRTFTFHEGIKNVQKYSFYDCKSLETVIFKGTPTTIATSAFINCTQTTLTIKVPWAEGAVANAPWGATNATIIYNYTE